MEGFQLLGQTLGCWLRKQSLAQPCMAYILQCRCSLGAPPKVLGMLLTALCTRSGRYLHRKQLLLPLHSRHQLWHIEVPIQAFKSVDIVRLCTHPGAGREQRLPLPGLRYSRWHLPARCTQ
jgi:hypothetical protein